MASFQQNIANIRGSAVYGSVVRTSIAEALEQAVIGGNGLYITVDPIPGSSNYRLNIKSGQYDYLNYLSKDTNTSAGATLSWDASTSSYVIDQRPTEDHGYLLYENRNGFPIGLGPGKSFYVTSGSDNDRMNLVAACTTDGGSNWTVAGAGYAVGSLSKVTIPANANGIRLYFYIRASVDAFTNKHMYPVILAPDNQ